MTGNITLTEKQERRLSPMDYMAIIAGFINLLVIGYIVGYWFLK